jgi:hypothetical protein
MTASLTTALALGSLLVLAPSSAMAVTLDDCAVWLQKLRGEASGVQMSGAAARDNRRDLLEHLDKAALPADSKTDSKDTADALRNVEEFRKRAARLTSEGRVSKQEGQRLDTLGDTYRHCVEEAERKR